MAQNIDTQVGIYYMIIIIMCIALKNAIRK